MTPKDLELIDEAYSTTYKSTIRDLIKKADMEKCCEKLWKLLNNNEIEWED